MPKWQVLVPGFKFCHVIQIPTSITASIQASGFGFDTSGSHQRPLLAINVPITVAAHHALPVIYSEHVCICIPFVSFQKFAYL